MSKKLINYILVLEICFLFCCTHSFFPFEKRLIQRTGYIDSKVQDEINHFKKSTGIKKIWSNIYVISVSKNHDWAARCYSAYNTIIIDKDTWKGLGKLQKIWLIYHEMGHCRYKFEHIRPETGSWYKRRKFYVMNPTIPPKLFLNKRRFNVMLALFLKRI